MKEADVRKRLQEFTPYIRMKARAIADGPWDWEDFEQEGRIALWKALEFDPHATKSFLHQRIQWRMLDYARRIYPNKEVAYTPKQENMLYGNFTIDDDGSM